MPREGWSSKKTKSWPEGTRQCTQCKEIKSVDDFGLFKGGAKGRYPVCNPCRRIKAIDLYKNERKTYQLYYRAKVRAKKKKLEFSIQEKDIFIPALCPVFKIPMKVPSLDRKDSSKGYTKDNIQVISNRANVLKNNATIEELELVIEHLKKIKDG